ncbi:MAG: hypothetical protein IPJ48_16085 [Propionivibrio sp.]|uniref:Chain length determinant protein n=1 Tax=Candidatus Propionivibrio dominans TaxID=2954373 RepID=A0A9D7FG22_9RHOO|nr:hypothetical protein [Candidatus Propionivibrio dominans]MBL0167324.1 hypothetical protein [Propionivibrio sp.]
MNSQLRMPPPPADPREYLKLLAQQRGFIIVFVMSAAIISLALTYIATEKYESYTAITYRTQEVTRFKAYQTEAMGSPAPQAPFKVISQTLQEVLKSDAILRNVVTELGLDQKPKMQYDGPWYQVWYKKTRDWAKEYSGYAWTLLKYGRIVEDNPTAAAINELRNNFTIVNRDSYIFHLRVRDREPERAARIADHMGKVLAALLLDLDREPNSARIEQLRALLEEKHEMMKQRRKEMESLLADNRSASIQLEVERLTENRSTLQLDESRLASEIARAQTRLSSIESKLSVKQRILEMSPTPTDPVEYIQPEDFKKLASQRVFDDMDLKSLVSKRHSLQTSIDALTVRLGNLPKIQNRLDTLKVELASIERDYTLLNDSYQEAVLRASSAVSEVRVLHPAVVPTFPVAPNKIYYVLLASGLGVLFATGLLYLLAYLNIRILFPSSGIQGRRSPSPVAGPPPGTSAEPSSAPPLPEGKENTKSD